MNEEDYEGEPEEEGEEEEEGGGYYAGSNRRPSANWVPMLERYGD